jgi:LysR family transcriptional regulator, low CO2-responsive transcriptional regulator
MHYTLHQLQIFVKIAEKQSITKAAEELHLTQPAISIQLKNFQDQFEIPLTEVIGRQIYLTDFGKEVEKAAQSILSEVGALQQKVNAYKGQLTGKLKVSVVSTGKYIMPYFLNDFLSSNPEVELQLDVTNKSRVIEALEQNEVDMVLVSIIPEHIKVEKLELLPNQIYLVGQPGLKFKNKNIQAVLDSPRPLIFREEGSGTRSSIEKFMNEQKLQISKKIELTSNEAVKQAILAGLGYSFMPIIGLKNELTLGQLEIYQIKGLPIRSQWNLIWHSGKKFSPVADAFVEHIRSSKQELISRYFNWYEQFES